MTPDGEAVARLAQKDLAESVLEMREDDAVAAAREAVDCGLDAQDVIDPGFIAGMTCPACEENPSSARPLLRKREPARRTPRHP